MINKDERINEINDSLRLIEKTDGLTFGTDAYLLSALIPKRQNQVGAELGCGTGVISLLISSRKKCRHVYAFEVQKEFSELAERNAEINGLAADITVLNKNVKDAFPSDINGEVDFVFTNPPYMKATSGKENEADIKNIARHEVCGDIGDFCACAKRILKFGGYFYAVYRPDRMTDILCAMRDNGLEPKRIIFIHPNSSTPPSLMLICAKKGGKSGLIIEPPLYIYNDKHSSEYTERFAKIYENCSLEF